MQSDIIMIMGDEVDRVCQMDVVPGMGVDELVKAMASCGFGARRLSEAVDIYEEMLSGEYTKFFALAGAMVPAGMRNLVSGLIRRGHIDVLVTTGANLVHDVIESFGFHSIGNCDADDAALRSSGQSRIYDVYLSDENFIKFEEVMQSILPDTSEPLSGCQFMKALGSKIEDERSILRSAYEKGIPVFCPAMSDSMIGLQAWLASQTRKVQIDAISDIKEIVDICYGAKKAGIMILGGGVPKNFALQSMLVTPKSFDLAIQLTTDRPEPGGLSGATLSEAVSWGKISSEARHVTVYGDATINFPLIVASTLTRLERSRD